MCVGCLGPPHVPLIVLIALYFFFRKASSFPTSLSFKRVTVFLVSLSLLGIIIYHVTITSCDDISCAEPEANQKLVRVSTRKKDKNCPIGCQEKCITYKSGHHTTTLTSNLTTNGSQSQCNKKKIYFLKTFKTGSTTMYNILFR